MPAGETIPFELESLRSLWRGNCWHPTSAEPRQERFLPSSGCIFLPHLLSRDPTNHSSHTPSVRTFRR